MLKRNLHFAPKSVKCKAYFSCVLPIIEYASNIWAPTTDKMNNEIEMVQHNAARFITNTHFKRDKLENYSITKILNNLKFDTIEERRKQSRLTMAYKIINNYVVLESHLLPKVNHSRPTRDCNSAKVGKANQLPSRDG